jgi:hypothetical protein
MTAIKKPFRQTRGIRFSDDEWAAVLDQAKQAGLTVGAYVRAQTLPPVPPAPPRIECDHEVVLAVGMPGRAVPELCQCAECGLVGWGEIGRPVMWAS